MVNTGNSFAQGPMVRATSTSASGYVWLFFYGNLSNTGGGYPITNGGCPTVTNGQVGKLTASGTGTVTLTCLNVTTSASATFTDTTIPQNSGSPGMQIQLFGTTDGLSNFVASSP
jgi:hypothetical protein